MFTVLALNSFLIAYPAPQDPTISDKGPGYLGVTFEAVSDNGILITEIRDDGPARHAGLKVHDTIVRFDGKNVIFQNFPGMIIDIRPGTVVPLEVLRDGKKIDMTITIGLRPQNYPVPVYRQTGLSSPPSNEVKIIP